MTWDDRVEEEEADAKLIGDFLKAEHRQEDFWKTATTIFWVVFIGMMALACGISMLSGGTP